MKETRKAKKIRETKQIREAVKLTHFEDLRVYQLAHQLSIDVANLFKSFPKEEKYDLAGQR